MIDSKLHSIGTKILTEENAQQSVVKQVGTTDVLKPNAQVIFDGDSVTWLTDGKSVKRWKAESGLTVKNTKPSEWGKLLRRYSVHPTEWSKDKNAGPTPPGNYLLGDLQSRKGEHAPEISQLRSMWLAITHGSKGKWTDETQSFDLDTIYSRIGWGNFRAPVIARKGTETFGRGSFYLHGGSVPGSHGCIDLTNGMDDFAKFYGTWLTSNNKKSVPLVVDYGEQKNGFFRELWRSVTTRETKPERVRPNRDERIATRKARREKRRSAVQQPQTPQVTAPTGILRMGARGDQVKALQTQLKNVNFDPGVIDGIFGKNTARALIQFQNANGLKADGVFGPNTSRKLFST